MDNTQNGGMDVGAHDKHVTVYIIICILFVALVVGFFFFYIRADGDSGRPLETYNDENSRAMLEIDIPQDLPLVASQEHDVIVITECDLAIKYEKEDFKNPKVGAVSYFSPSGSSSGTQITLEPTQEPIIYNGEEFAESPFKMMCAKSPIEQVQGDGGISTFPNQWNLLTTLSRENLEEVLVQTATGGPTGTSYVLVDFKHGGYYYSVDAGNYPAKFLRNNNVEIQFDSLAPSIASVQLAEDHTGELTW